MSYDIELELNKLSERQRRMVHLLGGGFNRQEIAKALGISIVTVRREIRRIGLKGKGLELALKSAMQERAKMGDDRDDLLGEYNAYGGWDNKGNHYPYEKEELDDLIPY